MNSRILVPIVLSFIIGPVLGSFVGMLKIRIPVELSLSGRSRCDTCFTKLPWKESIPLLSFLILKGKCRNCGSKISKDLLLLELFFIPLVSIPLLVIDETILIVAWIIFLTIGLALSLIDFRWQRLPNLLTFPLFGLLLLLIILRAFIESDFKSLLRAVLVVVVAVTIFILIRSLSKNNFGLGDIKFIASISLITSTISLVATFVALFVPFVLGTFYSIYLILLKKGHRRSSIPFGPFLFAGAAFSLMTESVDWVNLLLT